MSFKVMARSFIAAQNGKFAAARIARMAEQYLNAYCNLANWDMAKNGELRVLKTVASVFQGAIIDAGANEGQWAKLVLPFIGDNPLHSFEPVPDIFKILEKNLAGNPNVTLVNAGLGAEDKNIEIFYSPALTTISSAYPLIYDGLPTTTVPCTIMKGDSYLARECIDTVALLKIDIEGMEAECLEGFSDAFAKRKICCVQFEHGPSHVHSGHTLKHFNEWFSDRDFQLFEVFPKFLRPLNYNISKENYTGQNFFAIRNDLSSIAKFVK